MDTLPDELIVQIISFLAISDLVNVQIVSRRYLELGRDNAIWKLDCFKDSRAEALRRRQQLQSVQDPRLAELRNAVSALPGGDLTAWDVSQIRGSLQPRASSDPDSEARIQRHRALANWEPAYPHESLDYYEEYIHRHAPISVGWLDLPKRSSTDADSVLEATGIATLNDVDGRRNRVVAPMNDGSISIWDLSQRSTSVFGGGGKILARSAPGLLSGQAPDNHMDSHMIMTEVGAVECVAVDSNTCKGYFAVQNCLHEVDLQTFQLASTKQYPFPITALSEANIMTPVTVGTNMTIHLYDPRDPAFGGSDASAGGELIGGSLYSHATLAQPGPLSILHNNGFEANDSSIWVAGRFTSLLNYDRRFFPRLRETKHSGARIAALSSIPYPLIPRNMDLLRNPGVAISTILEARSRSGMTMLAAAEYKGKGSLELYGLPRMEQYQNRQTASASKLLSVAPHGGQIVFSDGDGNIKWMERDGFSHVRTVNINDCQTNGPSDQRTNETPYGIWQSTAQDSAEKGDIVQKILPTNKLSESTTTGSMNTDRYDINQSNLLLWTGDGAIGVLGFGKRNPLEGGDDDWHDAVETQAMTAEQRAREDAEKQYAGAMRRALERNADEVRFVRGLGMGFTRQ